MNLQQKHRMKTAAAAVVLAVPLSIATACGSGPPPTCQQQMQAWRSGPAKPLVTDLAEKLSVLNLPAAGADAAKLQAYPMPACTDRGHYFTRLLTDVQRAGNIGFLGSVALEPDIAADLSGLNSELPGSAG